MKLSVKLVPYEVLPAAIRILTLLSHMNEMLLSIPMYKAINPQAERFTAYGYATAVYVENSYHYDGVDKGCYILKR